MATTFQRCRQRAAGGDSFPNVVDRVHHDGVAQRVANDRERVEDRHAGGTEGSERPGESRDRDVPKQGSKDGDAEKEAVDHPSVFRDRRPGLPREITTDSAGRQGPPPRPDEVCEAEEDQGRPRQGHTLLLERDHQLRQEERDEDRDADSHDDQHDEGVDRRAGEFTAEFDASFEEIGELVQDVMHLPRSIGGPDHAHDHVVERRTVFPTCLMQGTTGLDPFDQKIQNHSLFGTGGLLSHRDQALHQGETGFDSGRQFPHQGRDVGGGNGWSVRLVIGIRLFRFDHFSRGPSLGTEAVDGGRSAVRQHGSRNDIPVWIDGLVGEGRHSGQVPKSSTSCVARKTSSGVVIPSTALRIPSSRMETKSSPRSFRSSMVEAPSEIPVLRAGCTRISS